MDCLSPALLEIPEGNWYCIDCDNSENEYSESEEESVEEDADIDEVYDLQNEIEQEIGQLPSTRLRTRSQPQIIRTLQSERIRNAILARRSLRSAAQTIENSLVPSTSRAIAAATTTTNKKPVKRRKTTRRRRRRATKVVEYEIKDGQKFPIKTTRVVRRKKRKTRKVKRPKRTSGGRSCASTSSKSTSFKNCNANVYELQKGRQLAGLNNFNIFEPTNLLDYVPDDDFDEEMPQNGSGSTLVQSVVNYTNPHRRQALIKKRVIESFASTSSNFNIIDSILSEQSPYDGTTSFNKLSKDATKEKVKKSTSDHYESGSNLSQNNNSNNNNVENTNERQNERNPSSSNIEGTDNTTANNSATSHDNNKNPPQNVSTEIHNENVFEQEKKSPQKKKKPRTFDMFGDSPVDQENSNEDEHQDADICPNFSIYGSVNRSPEENVSESQHEENMISMNEENVDLVQMSSDGEQNISEEIEQAVVRSQPASPDLENDQIIGDERSYTPPIVSSRDEKSDENVEKRRRDHHRDHHKKHKRRELERYNVRERLKEKSPKRARDRFGRNRTRTRSRSRSHERYSRKRSRSHSRDRHRSRHKKSRTPEKRRKRSYSKSLSRGRDSSEKRHNKNHKNKHKRSYRRTKSRSFTPPQKYREKSPRRRDRSTSDKSKKKKRRNRSKDDKPTTHTKEVFTSGQNILVSVNFNSNNSNSGNNSANNQDDKRSTRSKSSNDNKDETIVDITAKKKINVNSKPVAIIDLARSPFKELTPEYKKESNVIELSDSEGEKHLSTATAPPDSTKLYDPFDIFNSPSNENVSSSQTTTNSTLKALNKNSVDFTNKLGPSIIKNLNNLPLITNNEENLVSSSSSVNNIFDKVLQSVSSNNNSTLNNITAVNSNKIEVIQNEVIPPALNLEATIESPYSPGNDFDDDHGNDHEMDVTEESKTSEKPPDNMFDALFGSSTPPFLEKAKSKKKCKTLSHIKAVNYFNFTFPSFNIFQHLVIQTSI